ncbi:alpha/beta hydrolase fold domain-containing protein [Actomonas aquatica]|uniref:Alpha/beta hydrolase fold domain-containing protein n=1 Tax=Actomonas aquatica TaxID=2866162 RepID=A0ABZ1C877_9BACT|nr:alpha/beta hydrolase fold domain-containing protein [Opitutus sp. WL0086]WRQ87898.1 alpha/beta hydrolase fold domain-containing protein [Opitutus sp. WL0086]
MKLPFRSRPAGLVGLIALAFTSMISLPAQDARPLPDGVIAHRDLPYVVDGHERQVLDLYLPESAEGPVPLFVWIHGGAWRAGNKDGVPPLRQGFVGQGYAVASLNYRLSQHATFPAQIEDCKAAIRWLRAHAADYGIDPDHVAVGGSSAGGHLAALVGTSGDVTAFDVGAHLDESSRVQAVVDYFGPTDFTQMDAHALPDSPIVHDDPASPESVLIGGAIQDPANYEKVQAANSITYVTSDDPPFLIIHGDADPVVAHHQSELLHAALGKLELPSHFVTVEGGGHGRGFPGDKLVPIVSAFLDLHLRGKTTAATEWPTAMTSSVPAGPIEPPPARANNNAAANNNNNNAGNRSGPPTWAQLTERSDRNHDGKISREEFPGPDRLFGRLDADGDGFLTEAEHNQATDRLRRRN